MTALVPLVAGILGVAESDVDDTTGAATTAHWTSLRHVQIVVAVQDAYGVRIAAREARRCRSVGALRAVLAEKGVEL
ncbi:MULTISPECIES: acyl carrier protein [Actinosynnema]|uniref:Carrier domain-containing protein n=1 Tax=Actinosynnema pretiosum TaxID=42197 RepID=A0A290Z7L0_9PSEU|nr:acyl carrier protein [Actinosynnema pretiosum]ATE55010.1 hypothetical protein CNX65_18380 [Actinosynnema pretiosum]